ncbi:protein kinase domain-containing protein [Lachnospiraceae bacterium C1.1]|nr:protein kinase [Lachnospiraceae bacterium C1.1]
MIREGLVLAERYEIISKIGTGGMSDVYRAKDYKLNRFVAVKVLKAEFSENKNFVAKFRVEAQSAAALIHPNIVNVYDVGEERGLYYIVMELVEGITLKHYIEKKLRLSFKEAISIAIQVSMGLEAAHDNHVIHRDVKPQNIIISKEGKVKVTDFGIARAATSDTITSNVMGSVHYTSPEQARGGYSDEKSDIYSLGIVLYEMLTGRVPFDGETTVAIAIKQIQEPMPNPRNYVDDIPVSAEYIIYKCCEKNADRRYSSMKELITDLKQSLVTPNENFVRMVPSGGFNAETKLMDDSQVGRIKKKSQSSMDMDEDILKAYEPTSRRRSKSYDYDDEWDDEDVRVEKVRRSSRYRDEDDEDEEEERTIRRRTSSARNPQKDDTRNRSRDRKYREEETKRSKSNLAREKRQRKNKFGDVDDDDDDINPGMQKLMAILAILMVIIILVIIIVIGRRLFGSVSSKLSDSSETVETTESTETVTISDVVGMNFSEARNDLQEMGLKVQSTTVASSAEDKNKVIAIADEDGNALESGSSVASGSTVVLSVGTGQSTEASVPDVTGVSRAEAKVAIENAGFVFAAEEVESSEVTKGNVISQSPEAGKTADTGSTVTVKVSKGSDTTDNADSTEDAAVTRTVPNIVGMTETAAKTALTASGLSFESITESYSDTVTAGLVISQSPTAGSQAADGSGVNFVLSLGPESKTYGGTFSVAAPPSYVLGTTAELVVTSEGGTVLASSTTSSFPAAVTVKGAAVSSGTLTVTYKKQTEVEYEDDDGNIVTKTGEETTAVYQTLTFTQE